MFQKFATGVRQKSANFMAKLPGAIAKGQRFFNNKIMPAARLAHRVIKGAHEEVSKSDIAGEKVKHASKKLNEWSDIGLKHISDLHGHTQKAAAMYGDGE